MPAIRTRGDSATARRVAVAALAAVTLGVGLGGSGRLSYHEAIIGEAAREMLAGGGWLVPTVGGQPWLEKPPLMMWLVAAAGRVTGGVGEAEARLPSAVAAAFLAVGVAGLAARRFGPRVGLLAGLVQATTSWTVLRGRLADADMLLACLVTWTLVAFDHLRPPTRGVEGLEPAPGPSYWRLAFFAGLGLTALAKGVGFGAALVLVTAAACLAWDRDRETLAKLRSPVGWGLATALALAWPLLTALRHPSALGLWFLHVSDRLAENPEHFTGSRPWWFYGPAVLGQLLPWTPLALVGAYRSLPRVLERSAGAGDRLLWAWAIAPVALLSIPTIKSAHYAIYALPPWSVWSASGLVWLGGRLRARRGWSPGRVRAAGWGLFGGLGVAYAVGFAAVGPWLDARGRGAEWAFYQAAGHALKPDEPVVLLYNVTTWDRAPYATPFGPVPHDWAVRLFYLGHPAPCRFGVDDLARSLPPPSPSGFALIGRADDLPALQRLGQVIPLASGPTLRASRSRVDDRTYRLYRVRPDTPAIAKQPGPRPLRR